MKAKLTAGALMLALTAHAADSTHHHWKAFWILSSAALTAATFVDAASSAGNREANPLLQNSQGRFSSARGIALKGGLLSGTLIVQSILQRKHEANARSFSATNLAAAGGLGLVAWRNYALRH